MGAAGATGGGWVAMGAATTGSGSGASGSTGAAAMGSSGAGASGVSMGAATSALGESSGVSEDSAAGASWPAAGMGVVNIIMIFYDSDRVIARGFGSSVFIQYCHSLGIRP